MKIFISADIEGVTGATHWDETDKKSSDYEEFSKQMTEEVIAACEGALEAGAKEIWVRDAHDSARNIIPAKLPREVKLVRGWSGHPFEMVQELEESFDAMMMVGYHSWAGSGADPLAHTISSGVIIYIQINDMYVSEFILNAYTGGLVKVPVVFVSGDAGICEQAESFIPGIQTVAVKHGVGNSTVSIHPHLAVERIRESVQEALEGDVSKCRVKLPKHFSVEIKYKEHSKAYKSSFYPGVTLKEPTVIQFEADDYFEVLRAILFVV